MGVAIIQGIQSQHVMAMAKHFVAYDSEGTNIFVDDQTLHEVYVAPFEAAIRRADVSSVMCSYNHINGTFACGNSATLSEILRDRIRLQGLRDLGLGRNPLPQVHECWSRHGDDRRACHSAATGFPLS